MPQTLPASVLALLALGRLGYQPRGDRAPASQGVRLLAILARRCSSHLRSVEFGAGEGVAASRYLAVGPPPVATADCHRPLQDRRAPRLPADFLVMLPCVLDIDQRPIRIFCDRCRFPFVECWEFPSLLRRRGALRHALNIRR